MRPSRYRVRRVRGENADTFTMELETLDQSEATPFTPGQFHMLYVFGNETRNKSTPIADHVERD
jgi:NAD(P)H-flavin reductase